MRAFVVPEVWAVQLVPPFDVVQITPPAPTTQHDVVLVHLPSSSAVVPGVV